MSGQIENTIAAHWEHFERVDIPPDAPNVQRDAMKVAFYSGVGSGIRLSLSVGRSENPKEAILNLNSEISCFSALRNARRGG